jgi:hypothetical protein
MDFTGKTFTADKFGSKNNATLETAGTGGFYVGDLKTSAKFSEGWSKKKRTEDSVEKEIDNVNSLSKSGLLINTGNVNVPGGDLLAQSLKLKNLAKNKIGSVTVSDAGNMNFISPANYYFKTGDKETTWFNSDGVTTDKANITKELQVGNMSITSKMIDWKVGGSKIYEDKDLTLESDDNIRMKADTVYVGSKICFDKSNACIGVHSDGQLGIVDRWNNWKTGSGFNKADMGKP